MKILKKVGKAFTNPSPRGKVRWAFLGIVILAIAAAAVDYPKGFNRVVDKVNQGLVGVGLSEFDTLQEKEFNLGLDLQGGALLVYQADLSSTNINEDAGRADSSGNVITGETTSEAMSRLKDRIERRVNALGVSEPVIQVAGKNRLVVELAGVDIDEAIDRIGETPLLEFREKNTEPPRELTEEEQTDIDEFNDEQLKTAEEALLRVTSGTESFEDVARELSEDAVSKESGGDIGAITPSTNRPLSEATKDTLIGKVVSNVVDLPDAYYVIRVDNREETDVEMKVSHILICYSGAQLCTQERSRNEARDLINEIAAELTKENFSEKAVEFSNDPSVQQNQGDLDFLAPGVTVPAFEEAAKSIAVGEISGVIETDFGFHIIYKTDERPFGETFLHSIKLNKRLARDVLPRPEEYIPTALTGASVEDAQLVFDPQTNSPQISIQFDDEGTKLFGELTEKYLGEPIAIYLDGQPISVPVVQAVINNGQAVITGRFTIPDARELARQLRDGALPVSIELVQQQTVGASLGVESLKKSLKAALIGLLLVAIFMLLYYRLLGVLAVLALGVYGLTTLMIFKLIGVTLTLAGIAGFVLSLGMAVDANVLIFERFREERKKGKDLPEATEAAFKRAWPSIRDGNVSTLITCFILAYQGTSVVKGFAITLGLGIMVSMFSAIIVTKNLMRIVIGWRSVKKLTFLFGTAWRLKG